MSYSSIGILSGFAHEIEEQTGSRREASDACGAVAAGRTHAGAGCGEGWRTAPDGVPLARGARFARIGCASRNEQGRSSRLAGRRGTVSRTSGVARRSPSAWLWYTALDDQARAHFHRAQVPRSLQRGSCLAPNGAIGLSSQKPERRAPERDEAVIEHRKKRTWPGLKKKPAARGN